MSIHNYEKRYAAALDNVERSALSEKNKQCIFRFANDLLLEGLSKSRIMRYVGTLKMLGEVIGMETGEEKKESQLLPRKCPRCDIINAFESKHCSKCGGILDLRYAMELEEKRKEQEEVRNNADTLMNMLMKDPDVQKVLMEKIAQMKA